MVKEDNTRVNFNDLDGIAPTIFKYPIEKTIKAIINLRLKRKIASSIIRLLALALGLVIGYYFPQIGGLMAFLISLVAAAPLGIALTTGITMASSMFLSAVVMLYLAKKAMQYYYKNKYGVSNPENRFTTRDHAFFVNKYSALDEQDLKKLIQSTKAKIEFLVYEINRFKISGEVFKQKNAKHVLNSLKLGDISGFYDHYSDELSRPTAKQSIRQQKLLELLKLDNYLEEKIAEKLPAHPKVDTLNLTRLYQLKRTAKAKDHGSVAQLGRGQGGADQAAVVEDEALGADVSAEEVAIDDTVRRTVAAR